MVGNKFEKILGWERQGELDSLNQSFYETIVSPVLVLPLLPVPPFRKLWGMGPGTSPVTPQLDWG